LLDAGVEGSERGAWKKQWWCCAAHHGLQVRRCVSKTLMGARAYASAGLDPSIMSMGPVPALRLCLQKAGWKAEELNLMDISGAFAAQACPVNKEMGWDSSKISVKGGAITNGHPVGASGCWSPVRPAHEMIRRDAHEGLASLCIGGGLGVSLAVER
jgi:acetyl-CoA C-acetyltransferase